MHFFALFILNFSQKHRQGPFLCNFQPKTYSTLFFQRRGQSLRLPRVGIGLDRACMMHDGFRKNVIEGENENRR